MIQRARSPDEPSQRGTRAASGGRDSRGEEQLDPHTTEAIQETFRRSALAQQQDSVRRRASSSGRVSIGFLRHWLLIINLAAGVFVTLPWLAPLFMEAGQEKVARAIYVVYSTQCHQLPQRSFFLFGEKPMYSLGEIQAAWQDTNDPNVLRKFVGNPEMGWKVAWSDRMVSMYTSVFFAGLAFALVRKRLRPLPIWAFGLLILPLAVDGATHLVSDLAGFGNGFRDANSWLVGLAVNQLPDWFTTGEGLGSFNSWMRLLTGALFGVGAVGLGYPHFESIWRPSTEGSPRVVHTPPDQGIV